MAPMFRMFATARAPEQLTASPNGCTGKVYRKRVGAFVDVPKADAGFLAGNGWCHVDAGAVAGPSSERPRATPHTQVAGGGWIYGSTLELGQRYLDTTLGKFIVYDGEQWRDAVTGAPA